MQPPPLRPASLQPAITVFCFLIALAVAPLGAADERPSLTALHNYHAVTPTLLTAGQLTSDAMPALRSAQVELVINLAVADAERNSEEAFAVAQAGVSYLNIPVDWAAPTVADLELFYALMDGRGERKTLVHCFANYRASAFTYLYRVIREGVPQQEAEKDLWAIWSEEAFGENPVWQEFVNARLTEAGLETLAL